ncbi:hypothetical protein KV102_12010 [Mumia sp. zg.B53]|uniref:hypothetical protein n=1 Tax=unclassified Mumia TaxID=2621872 RepID=UPI001C6EC4A1|nr:MULTISPECIES: hypothetical protein [unclassified Mumia]MBW9206712.1 hypothetical protein [Mumia sp. zg.B17]MBW9211001.1 hypothetical protein [Mumia sp. zg.B21]MBW9215566.1 hypothetical protein [Mumia sp. zg.B53]MDD9349444.1 hypothetical protein [Mumia sp.]
MKILLWLAVPLAVTALAMLWAAWYGRRGADASHGVDRSARSWGPGDPAYARFSDAVQRPLPAAVHARQSPQPPSGVVVRRAKPESGR